MKGRFIVCTAFTFGAVFFAMIIAQAASSTRDSVYTAAQADKGHVLYTAQCAMCHGEELKGSGQNPALAGPVFEQDWQGETLSDLYTTIQTTMPATKPASLQPEEVAELMAYILSENKFPAGKTDLPSSVDELQAIHFDPPATGAQ